MTYWRQRHHCRYANARYLLSGQTAAARSRQTPAAELQLMV
jgi:hypothetical protein